MPVHPPITPPSAVAIWGESLGTLHFTLPELSKAIMFVCVTVPGSLAKRRSVSRGTLYCLYCMYQYIHTYSLYETNETGYDTPARPFAKYAKGWGTRLGQPPARPPHFGVVFSRSFTVGKSSPGSQPLIEPMHAKLKAYACFLNSV